MQKNKTGITAVRIDEQTEGNERRLTRDKLLKYYEENEKRLNEIWKIWHQYYLLSLREKQNNGVSNAKECEPKKPENRRSGHNIREGHFAWMLEAGKSIRIKGQHGWESKISKSKITKQE